LGHLLLRPNPRVHRGDDIVLHNEHIHTSITSMVLSSLNQYNQKTGCYKISWEPAAPPVKTILYRKNLDLQKFFQSNFPPRNFNNYYMYRYQRKMHTCTRTGTCTELSVVDPKESVPESERIRKFWQDPNSNQNPKKNSDSDTDSDQYGTVHCFWVKICVKNRRPKT
jgi:hypothetical protein